MIRRSPLRLAAAAVATAIALSGCATFTDSDVAARVGDAELTEAQLSDLVRDAIDDDEATRAPLEAANTTITGWILNEALRADLAALGAPLPETGELTNASLQAAFGDAFARWRETPPRPFSRSEWAYSYGLGPIDSGVTCTAHILVDTEAEALAALAELDDGASFGDVAAARSTDPGSQTTGGVIPCSGTSSFANSFAAEYVQATFEAEIGEPVGPIRTDFGYHIILVREFAEIDLAELEPLLVEPAVRYPLATRHLDVYVNPRYGSYEGGRGIVALG